MGVVYLGGDPDRSLVAIKRSGPNSQTPSFARAVMKTYGEQITVESHPYEPQGHYLVYMPDDQDLLLIFETDGHRVTSSGRVGPMPSN